MRMKGVMYSAGLLLMIAMQAGAAGAAGATSGDLAAGTEALAASQYDRAEKELAAITGKDRPAAQLALARVYAEQGKDREAEAALAQAQTNFRHESAVLRSELLARAGKLTEAIRAAETAKGAPGSVGRRARLRLGEYKIATGKRADAEPILMSIVAEYNDQTIATSDAEGLAMVGRAAHLLRSPKDANTAFNESERIQKRVETLLWRAELFLDKYDPGHAEEVAKEALTAAPNLADAKVMMARIKLAQTLDFDAADALASDALKTNPRLSAAHAVRAGLALRDMSIDRAEREIALGFSINPNDLELWSVRAATRLLAEDKAGYEAAKKETFSRNAEYTEFYGIVSEYAEWEHRYDDIVGFMKEAVARDPEDAKAWAQLGVMQMRGGDETTGLQSLQRAWQQDRFNVRVFNTLNLYEQQIAQSYELVPTDIFKIRYAKDEKPVLERYVPQMLGQAWASMKARYGFVPTTPVQVELYRSREQFSVRTSGLPNIGIQGVCFGRVVAAMSPKSEPFNWGNVLWHELGHVYAIQLSKSRVPRWFTEGLSEYETIARRPEWNRELDPELYAALKAGTLPKSIDMNRAFTHAGGAEEMTVAYYASSQMLVFAVERFGMAKVVSALKVWGEGKPTTEVFRQAFAMTGDEFDAAFRAWALDRLKRYDSQFVFAVHPKAVEEARRDVGQKPTDPRAQVVLALSLLRSGKGKEAKQTLAEALRLDPQNGDARFLAAKIAAKEKDYASARGHLDVIRKSGRDGYLVQYELAQIAEAEKDARALRHALESAHRYDPSRAEIVKAVYELAVEEKRKDDAFDALKKLADLDQHEPRVWRSLLEELVERKLWDEAVRRGESAIFVDVLHGKTHELYARALAATGRHAQAVYELDSALLCKGDPKQKAEQHALRAKSLAALGKADEAKKAQSEALSLDPENPTVRAAP